MNSKIVSVFLTCCLGFYLSILLSGCNQDDYLVDGGVASPYYEGNVMEYLESRPDLFNDLVKIVKMTKWERVFRDENEAVTFFAPTDFSIERGVNYLNNYLYRYTNKEQLTDFSQIRSSVWEDIIGMYVMKGKFHLKDIAQIDTMALSTFSGETHLTYSENYKMTMGVYYESASGIPYAGARRMMYIYPDAGRINSHVSSCNIEPCNGVVHVLRLDHYLGFLQSKLYDEATDAGLVYPAPSANAPIKPIDKREDDAITYE